MTEKSQQTVTPQQYKEANRILLYWGERLCDTFRKCHSHLEIAVDEVVALNVSVATYDDIDRYKNYHLRNKTPLERSDVVKRAAYFAKWINKLRPIMIKRIDSSRHVPDVGLMLNEIFATSLIVDLISCETEVEFKLSHKYHADLLYDLHYRNLDDDSLLSIVQMIVDIIKAKKQNRDDAIIELSVP